MDSRSTTTPSSGRSSQAVAAAVRARIRRSRLAAGHFLPSVRELARTHSVDMKTALRAMKVLEADGLVLAVPGRGFRVMGRGPAPAHGATVASVGLGSLVKGGGAGFAGRLAYALGHAAAGRGYCLISVPGDAGVAETVATLKEHRAVGAVMDRFDEALAGALVAAGIAAVLVDPVNRAAGVDTVMQDGQLGGSLAVDYLLARGRRRFAWLGNPGGGVQLADRLGGAMARLRLAGAALSEELTGIVEVGSAEETVGRFLGSSSPPDAIIAPWSNYMLAASCACRSAGLAMGRDIDLVGWCSREVMDLDAVRPLTAEDASAVITWSVEAMAEAALDRLGWRCQRPGMAPVLIKIPVELVEMSGRSGPGGA